MLALERRPYTRCRKPKSRPKRRERFAAILAPSQLSDSKAQPQFATKKPDADMDGPIRWAIQTTYGQAISTCTVPKPLSSPLIPRCIDTRPKLVHLRRKKNDFLG